jgi:hypothetical protein
MNRQHPETPIVTVYITKFAESQRVLKKEGHINPEDPTEFIDLDGKTFKANEWFRDYQTAYSEAQARLDKILRETTQRTAHVLNQKEALRKQVHP